MLNEKHLTTLKKMLIEQKMSLTNSNDTLQGSLRDATDELSTIDNHPADLATELFEREKDIALQVHNEDQLSQVNEALKRMEQGTYGICKTCNSEIPYDRLRAIPYTAFCIEHTEAKSIPTDRPIEEDIILSPVDNSFSNRQANDVLQDNEDSFRIVAQYGNSDTPSDFEGDFDHYNDLYSDQDNNMYAELDILHVSKKEALGGQISQAYAEEAAKNDYVD